MKETGLKEELIGIIRLKSRPQPQPKFTFFSLHVKKKNTLLIIYKFIFRFFFNSLKRLFILQLFVIKKLKFKF